MIFGAEQEVRARLAARDSPVFSRLGEFGRLGEGNGQNAGGYEFLMKFEF
jgi:hypothetical protein